MFLYSAGAYRDISDFVFGCSTIPYIDRNRNFSLRSLSITFSLCNNSTYIPAQGDKLKVEYSGTIVFIGRIKKSKHIQYDRMYSVEALNRLSDLQNYLVDWDTLQSDLFNNADTVFLSSFPISSVDTITQQMTSVGHGAATGQTISFTTTGVLPSGLFLYRTYWIKVIDVDTIEIYANSTLTVLAGFTDGGTGIITVKTMTINRDKYTSYDNEGYDNVKISYLVERMFAIAGFTLTSNLKTSTIGTFVKSGVNKIYTGDNFRIDLSALYSINQMFARDSRFTNTDLWGDGSAKITFFDFISMVYKSMSGFIVPAGVDSFTDYHAPTVGEVYTVADDNSYGNESSKVKAEYTDYSFVINYGASQFDYRAAYYQNSSLTIYESLKKGDGGNEIKWYDNLAILFEDMTGAAGDVETNSFWDVTLLGIAGANTRFTRYLLTNFTSTEIKTNVDISIKGAIENYLDIENQISGILQETYV